MNEISSPNVPKNRLIEKHRKDYRCPDYLITETRLTIDLDARATEVVAALTVQPNPVSERSNEPLVLDGQSLELVSLKIDGELLALGNYEITDNALRIHTVPQQTFVLETKVIIDPEANTCLEGLYMSNGKYCTQCEAEGFRRITYYLDRPDILSVYTTTITAKKSDFPHLLSNGNCIEAVDLDGGLHRVKWFDPFPKPCYLFALVAGDFDRLQDSYTVKSGRKVLLEIYVDKGKLDQCDHAMTSLKKAMKWDEDTYALEYDLDRYMIVAVGDFNMGAMENKGLNIFNTRYVLANTLTATDADFEGVESVIAHEYFHNWTGNRVTCRDWFQLSLKEGLTVFRDQEFSADMGSRAAKRIDDVMVIRGHQFAEDAGPMSHPVRPDSYIEMNNFYTVTVYDKGAEVIRMMETILGQEGFKKGINCYFERHDGQAVTCDDFVAAMEHANGEDLSQFKRWYSQAGTPIVSVEAEYNHDAQEYKLVLTQQCQTYHNTENAPFHIPIKIALLDRSGRELPLQLKQQQELLCNDVLHLKQGTTEYVFTGLQDEPVPSLGRDFSAPVKWVLNYSDDDLAFLLAHDGNAFNRWDAAQVLLSREVFRLSDLKQTEQPLVVNSAIIDALEKVINDTSIDSRLKSQLLTLPKVGTLLEQRSIVHIDSLLTAWFYLKDTITEALSQYWIDMFHALANEDTSKLTLGEHASIRALKSLALGYAMKSQNWQALSDALSEQFYKSGNMTEQISALSAAVNGLYDKKFNMLEDFYQQWQHEALVVDKWFAVQASSDVVGSIDKVRKLQVHSAFDSKNPNKVRALIGGFCGLNWKHFHHADGSGYRYLGDNILSLNDTNPQVAARLASYFNPWRKFDEHRQRLIGTQLSRILDHEGLSKDVYEIVSKAHSQPGDPL